MYAKGDQFENGTVIFDLLKAYYNPNFKTRVITFINESFSFAKIYSLENKKYDYLSGNPDPTTLLIIAQAIGSLNKEDSEQFSNLVFDIYTFCASDEKSYALHQTSGYIALLLTAYSTKFNVETLNQAIEITGKHYQENTFVHQTLYAKWILTNDNNSALSYLKLRKNKKGFTFAIIALTDLNCKEALPFLKSILKEEKEPVLIEVIKEAIERLKTQNSIPEINKRMIWLNGNLTPTQRALGAESDNIFIKRAKEKIELDDNIYETDDD